MSTSVMTEDMIDGNWSIGAPPSTEPRIPNSTHPSTYPPPVPLSPIGSQPSSQSPIPRLSRSTDQLAQRDDTGSPALPDHIAHNQPLSGGSRAEAQAQDGAHMHPIRLQAEVYSDDQGGMPGPTRRAGDVVSRVTSNYTNQVLASNLPVGGRVRADGDIQQTMKASKIQHDVVSWHNSLHTGQTTSFCTNFLGPSKVNWPGFYLNCYSLHCVNYCNCLKLKPH